MQIGELAAKTGAPLQTIRYYEKKRIAWKNIQADFRLSKFRPRSGPGYTLNKTVSGIEIYSGRDYTAVFFERK